MKHILRVAITLSLASAIWVVGEETTAWQNNTIGPRMQRRGMGMPDYMLKQAVGFENIAGSLGFQVYFKDGKLRLNQFTMVGYGAIPNAQERFRSQAGGFYYHYKLAPLGAVSSGAAGQLLAGPRNWARAEYGADEKFSLCVSRLCPGLLLRSKSEEGNANIFSIFEGISPPQYYAYYDGKSCRTLKAEGPGELAVSDMAEPWLLCWFGEASTIRSCSLPQPPYSWGTPDDRFAYLWHAADLPVLLVFQDTPVSVSLAPHLEISPADSEAGDEWTAKMIIMPLFGNLLPKQSETRTWIAALPEPVLQKCRWWSRHLDKYPLTVSESYAMHDGEAILMEQFDYESLRPEIEGFYAPVPPMLAMALERKFPMEFSQKLVSTGVMTSWGPCHAVENADKYSVTFKGLMKYIDESVAVGNGQVPEVLRQRLEAEVRAVLDAGHLAPYVPMFGEGCGRTYMATPEWCTAADAFIHMCRYLPLLPEAMQKEATAWLKSERERFPPEQTRQLDYASGTRRELYPINNPQYLEQQKRCEINDLGVNIHNIHKILPLDNIIGLGLWFDTAGNSETPDWPAIYAILEPYLQRMDWPSMGCVSWGMTADAYLHGQGGVQDINRLWLALRAAARLARNAGNAEAEAMCRAMFCKTAALRFCMGANYAAYLYDSGLKELPQDPAYLLKYGGGLPYARALNLYTPEWKSVEDDVQQIIAMDEFGTFFHETISTFDRNSIAPFRPMSPELARFLADFLKQDCARYVKRVEYFAPDWYCRYCLTCLGSEAYALPFDTAWQMILAKAWILGESGPALERYLDMPWLKLGDFFYMDKLAAVIMAYRGIQWQ